MRCVSSRLTYHRKDGDILWEHVMDEFRFGIGFPAREQVYHGTEMLVYERYLRSIIECLEEGLHDA